MCWAVKHSVGEVGGRRNLLCIGGKINDTSSEARSVVTACSSTELPSYPNDGSRNLSREEKLKGNGLTVHLRYGSARP